MGDETAEEKPAVLSDFSLDLPGTDWLFKRCPELFVLLGVVLLVGGGVAMLLSNPAGNSTSGDAYGPDAPLQPWVLVIAVLMFASGALLTGFLVVLLRQRMVGGGRGGRPVEQEGRPRRRPAPG